MNLSLKIKKGCFLFGLAGTGKSTMLNKLKEQLDPSKYRVCTPTLKAALVVDAQTIYSLFKINPHDHTYTKSTLDHLKSNGVEWIFIDEISMINSKVWACLRDFKRLYGFKFILSGDFGQLPPVEDKEYNVKDSQTFIEICDGRLLELTKNYRAEKCPEFKSFIEDQISVRNHQGISFNTYGNVKCRRSICWTNRTRKAINMEWMMRESKNKTCYLINNWKVFNGLPIIANITRTYKDVTISKNQDPDFEVVDTIGFKQMKNPKWADILKLLKKEKYVNVKKGSKIDNFKCSKITNWLPFRKSILNANERN